MTDREESGIYTIKRKDSCLRFTLYFYMSFYMLAIVVYLNKI